MEKALQASWWLVIAAFVGGLLLIYFGIAKTREGMKDGKPSEWKVVFFKDELEPGRLGIRFLIGGLVLTLGSVMVALIKLQAS